MQGKSAEGHDVKLARINNLLNPSPSEDYASVAGRLRQALELFHDVIAERLTGPLNERLAQLPHSTIAEKQTLSRLANEELRNLGVAIRCPKIDGPVFLRAVDGHHTGRGSFQFCSLARPYSRKLSSTDLFHLDLMGHPDRGVRHDSQESWTERTEGQRGRSDRLR